jgi:SAM-dependent methyltransferase
MKIIKEFYKEKKYTTGNHRHFIGGAWDKIGKLQFDFLLQQGVKKNHKVLDIGCGCFRLGVHLIPYLDEGNYYGIDIVESLIEDGKNKELQEEVLKTKKPNLLVNGGFEFYKFNMSFDYMMAQSVFTHLPLDRVNQCLAEAKKCLHKDSVFFATIFEAKTRSSSTNCEPYYVHPSFYEKLAVDNDLKFEYIGDWSHPRNQKLIKFYI